MNKQEINGLMLKIAGGDNAAFEQLYNKTKRGVFAFAYSYLRNYADAEDILQETFITVKQKAYMYSAGTNAGAWLFQIVKNLCIDELRKQKLRREKNEQFNAVPNAEPDLSELDFLISCLNDNEKEIVILHVLWGYKHREIAKLKNLPLGTVTWQYNAAIKKLRVHNQKIGKED